MPLFAQVVAESQVSLGESEKNTAPYILSATAAPAQVRVLKCTLKQAPYLNITPCFTNAFYSSVSL